jgi:hypothetical protein
VLKADEAAVLVLFRRDCCEPKKAKKIDPGQEQDWFSLSLGYFIAKGIEPKRAHTLAIHARYNLLYWEDAPPVEYVSIDEFEKVVGKLSPEFRRALEEGRG